MINRWPLTFFAATLLGCAAQAPSGRIVPAASADIAAIRQVFDTTAFGWNNGDLGPYLFAYVDSATTFGASGLIRGVKGIEEQMRAGFWRTGRPLQQLRYDHLEVTALGPNHALATGQYILSGGGRPDRSGWFTTIWARTPAGWRMIHDHSS